MKTTVVIGHYFKVSSQEKLRKESKMTCVNTSCRNHGNKLQERFCGKCGGQVQNMSFSSLITSNNPWDLLPRDLADAVCSWEYGDQDVWGINIKIPGGSGSRFEEHQGGPAIVITPELIVKEREAVLANETLKSIIGYMQQTYGQNSIELLYGAYCYAS
jgi:hypothetical protein